MKLRISKRIVKAGETIEVEWNCEDCSSPRLILNTGSRENTLAIPPTGTKRFRMKGNKGKHSIGLKAEKNGRERRIKKRIFVYGKTNETDSFEYIDRGDASPINQWNSRISNWWRSFTPEKKRLYILLLLLLTFNMLSSIPAVAPYSFILFYGIIFWLFWKVIS